MKLTKYFCLIFQFLIFIPVKLASFENISLLSISIVEIIEEFYSKYSKNIEIINFGEFQGELVTKIGQNLNNLIAVTIMNIANPQNWTKNITTQTILLFKNFSDLNIFNNKDLFETSKIKILVYCQNVTELELSMLETALMIPHHYFFIFHSNENENLQLLTFENRKDLQICHESQQLIKINEFSSKTQKWTVSPIFSKKYTNFYNCHMKLGLFYRQTILIRFIIEFRMNYDDISVDGPLVWILMDIQKRLNISIDIFRCIHYDCADAFRKLTLYNILYPATLDLYSFDTIKTETTKFTMLNIECM